VSPVGLDALLAGLPGAADPDLLVGFGTRDDAAVYRIGEHQALVLTADFITPPVDDPRVFGRVAAANALSDVYAMGGAPRLCLNLVAFPTKKLGPEALGEVIAGALEAITEAGALLGGGHSIEDEEPKFGLAVVGFVDPDRMWTNAGARPGDALVLTKPIGSGVLFNANRAGRLPAGALDACLAGVSTLNRAAAEVLSGFTVHAATDVTGFGLAGHALEIAEASDVTLHLELDAVPLYPHALAMYERGVTTGANAPNRERIEPHVRWARAPAPRRRELWVDPQTSGGLLAALPAAEADAAVAALSAAGATAAARIGSVAESDRRHRLVLG
jgi:selenide,water dikinase